MSRSNQTELVNPASKFFSWSGSEGKITYFDKNIGEKGENVEVRLPFTFLVLDKVAQVTGGVDDNTGYIGFWSNAVRNTKVQSFTVRSKRGIETQGLYEQIKGYPGVRFMTGLYIAYYEGETLQIGYLKIKGSALTAWIEFTKMHRNVYEGGFQITGGEQRKKGTTTYFEPVFEKIAKVKEATETAAIELDKTLQEYLTAYFAQKGIEEVEQAYAASANGHSYTGDPSYAPPSNYDAPDEAGDAWEPEI